MVIGKEKFTLWISPDAKAKVDYFYKQDNCRSQSEFIEKAVEFYAGYLHTQKASAYLPRVLRDVLEGQFSIVKKKLGRLIFKQAVETNITNHIIAHDTDIDYEQFERLRYRSVREVSQTNGEISFKDDLKFQKEV